MNYYNLKLFNIVHDTFTVILIHLECVVSEEYDESRGRISHVKFLLGKEHAAQLNVPFRLDKNHVATLEGPLPEELVERLLEREGR